MAVIHMALRPHSCTLLHCFEMVSVPVMVGLVLQGDRLLQGGACQIAAVVWHTPVCCGLGECVGVC